MKSIFINVVILVTFAAAISTYAAAGDYPGTLSFVPEGESITQTCLNNYQSGTPSVYADSTVWNNAGSCGKLVYIECNDASACTLNNYIYGVITSLCPKGDQCSTFTLTSADYREFATGTGAVLGTTITYSFL